MIIKEADVVITHFGIQGMRWGVRKDSYAQNREKAKNILSVQSKNEKMNKNDLKAAEWMSKSVPDKVASQLFRTATVSLIGKLMLADISSLKDPKVLLSIGADAAMKTAIKGALKEATSASSMRRYKQSGEKDISKKQYSKNSTTPEVAISRGVRFAMAVAPIVKAYGPISVHSLAERKRHNQSVVDARMKSWGPNLLDKKTSEFHTIYDDGYLSVLERIKKG